ncbi:hypothetical protein BDW42DRAFT_169578 [Aspergillus taichungensis]|uniref:Uncharacterized protein n=1 Tax=Aspergillus taichungensis TaxID=482145 RepID=A0A2J5HUN9_9EURO|nr:hypothetical protein BDW42DRAFT_169578 [Aspergillus taichungensis]
MTYYPSALTLVLVLYFVFCAAPLILLRLKLIMLGTFVLFLLIWVFVRVVIFILSIDLVMLASCLGVGSCSFVALIRDATRVGVDRRFSADSLRAGFIVYG